MKEIKVNEMYQQISVNNVNFTEEFFGWHIDGNKPIFRFNLGDKRSYIDVCVDCTYLLCSDDKHELFNSLCESLECKVLAYRKKSHQHVAKLSNEVDVIALFSTIEDVFKRDNLPLQKSKGKGKRKKQKENIA